MNIEEKARAYDEALERAKAAIDMAADKDLVKGVATTIFPELRESEDEKMRRKTINCLTMHNKGCVDAKDIDECIAWLEKQKEPKPAEWSEKDERILTHIQSHLKYLTEHRFEIKDYNTMEDRMILESEIEWLKNRFKSLRPSWKPSEEQMRCFDMVLCDEAMDENVHRVLVQLREQLKRLM